MEATAQSVEDHLIDSLSFKLRPGATYINNRRSVTYYPHGGNSYSPTGVKVIKLMLTGSDWLDPGSLRFMFELVNTDTTAGDRLYPISGPWSFSGVSVSYVVGKLWRTLTTITTCTRCTMYSLQQRYEQTTTLKHLGTGYQAAVGKQSLLNQKQRKTGSLTSIPGSLVQGGGKQFQ